MQRTLDLKYQDGGDKLQNLIADITVMRDEELFISVWLYTSLQATPRYQESVMYWHKCIITIQFPNISCFTWHLRKGILPNFKIVLFCHLIACVLALYADVQSYAGSGTNK